MGGVSVIKCHACLILELIGIYLFLFDGIEKVLKSHMYILGRGYCLQSPEASCFLKLPNPIIIDNTIDYMP